MAVVVEGNTHDVAQRAAPDARIVYVDHDPVVLTHAQALLSSSPHGKTDDLQADLRDTETILSGASRTLDFTIAPEASAEMAGRYNQMSSASITPRSRDQVARFFARLELTPPGLVPIDKWGLAVPIGEGIGGLVGYSGIGRKP
jgi:S-adenosyl methyltransferase